MKWNYVEQNYCFGIKMNEKECSRSVPIRNVPHHRKDSMYNIYIYKCYSIILGISFMANPLKEDYKKCMNTEYEVLFHDGME